MSTTSLHLILLLLIHHTSSSAAEHLNLYDLTRPAELSTPFAVPEIARIPEKTDREQQLNSNKENFSALAQELILVQNDLKIAEFAGAAQSGSARSVLNTNYEFCHSIPDGLYDDPENCEKFIICYVQQTFRTKCADGTKWNHHTKECDYPELVDCSRGTTTTTTRKPTTPTTTTRKPVKLSEQTTNTTAKTESTITPQRQKLRMDILLTIIVVPSGLLLLAVIILVLWVVKNKMERDSKNLQNMKSETLSSSMLKTTKAGCFCCCKKPADMNNNKSDTFNTTAHKTQKTDLSKINCAEHIGNTGIIPYSIVQNYDHVNRLIHGSACETVPDSRGATLSSHFEESNWDYNFAMRGLYLTQPWAKKNYSNTESLSIESSVGKTLAATNISNKMNNNKGRKSSIGSQKHGGSDTDGFYA